MKLQYKDQKFQEDAVNSVTRVFDGQPKQTPIQYIQNLGEEKQLKLLTMSSFKNATLKLNEDDILKNINEIQKENGILVDSSINKMMIGGKDTKTNIDNSTSTLTLSIEMETGTGKTYTYIKTMFELYKLYGWSKFIIVVPNIAIREGVAKSFSLMEDHFSRNYKTNIRSFVYNSKQLDKIETFANDPGINVMIVNTQAFNATGSDARRIDMVLDSFRSRRPIDVIAGTNPIIIVDEPQSVLGVSGVTLNKTRIGLAKFNPLFFINYSATHRENYNMVYRLDAIDAYQKKLVKKISVKGIEVSGSNASSGYLYLEGINESNELKAKVQFEKITASGKIIKQSKLLKRGDNIYFHSGELESYRNGYVISEINAINQFIEFTNGNKLYTGEVFGNCNDDDLRRIQIRETIKSHIEKEAELFQKDIKTLSLFFIDEVIKYKDYQKTDEKGLYAKVFEEEYVKIVKEYLEENNINPEYRNYLESTLNCPGRIHAGYFSVDKKGKAINSKIKRNSESSDDISAYDLIMKNKERLLSFDEPVRFIFSHSALKEGWDNPNVFQIATLRQSSSDIKKRQEIGRGLRLAVNQKGERQDVQVLGKQNVHRLNVLTIIANESYENFSKDLQTELSEVLKNRPQEIEPKLFEGRNLAIRNNQNEIISSVNIGNSEAAEIWTSLKLAKIINKEKQTTDTFNSLSLVEKEEWIAKALKKTDFQKYSKSILQLVESVYIPEDFIIDNERKKVTLKLDKEKYASQSFKKLWSKINRKTYYTVDFNEDEIIDLSIHQINLDLTVIGLKATVTKATQKTTSSWDNTSDFVVNERRSEYFTSIRNDVKYDLIGEVSDKVGLLRKTVARILSGINPEKFKKYAENPESFIANVSSIINGVKAQNIISHITYNKLDEVWNEEAIFVNSTIDGILGQNIVDAKKHLYDKVRYDSNIEKQFAAELDIESDVEMYVKLPGGFYINTPVGNYNPDWAIILNEETQKHIYFIAETKGAADNLSLELKGIENAKIKAARKHFELISNNEVKYDVVDSYEKLVEKLKW